MAGISTCAGCKHNWYSAPAGTDYIKEPHSRCLHFAANIPAVIERKPGCDGKLSNEWVGSIKPPDCPTFPAAKAKDGLLDEVAAHERPAPSRIPHALSLPLRV